MSQMKDLQNPLKRWISNFIGNWQKNWAQNHPGRVTGVPWISENTWRSPSSSTGAEATVNTHNSSFGSTLAIATRIFQKPVGPSRFYGNTRMSFLLHGLRLLSDIREVSSESKLKNEWTSSLIAEFRLCKLFISFWIFQISGLPLFGVSKIPNIEQARKPNIIVFLQVCWSFLFVEDIFNIVSNTSYLHSPELTIGQPLRSQHGYMLVKKGTSQYPRCVLITFVLAICFSQCFQVCYVRFKSVQRWGPCLIQRWTDLNRT